MKKKNTLEITPVTEGWAQSLLEVLGYDNIWSKKGEISFKNDEPGRLGYDELRETHNISLDKTQAEFLRYLKWAIEKDAMRTGQQLMFVNIVRGFIGMGI